MTKWLNVVACLGIVIGIGILIKISIMVVEDLGFIFLVPFLSTLLLIGLGLTVDLSSWPVGLALRGRQRK